MVKTTTPKIELKELQKFTFEGKKRAFLKSFSMIDKEKVPKKRITDIRNTLGTGSTRSQPFPTKVPLKS